MPSGRLSLLARKSNLQKVEVFFFIYSPPKSAQEHESTGRCQPHKTVKFHTPTESIRRASIKAASANFPNQNRSSRIVSSLHQTSTAYAAPRRCCCTFEIHSKTKTKTMGNLRTNISINRQQDRTHQRARTRSLPLSLPHTIGHQGTHARTRTRTRTHTHTQAHSVVSSKHLHTCKESHASSILIHRQETWQPNPRVADWLSLSHILFFLSQKVSPRQGYQ